MITVKYGVYGHLDTNMLLVLANDAQRELPITRGLQATLIDLPGPVGGMIAFVGVAKVGRFERIGLGDFGEILQNPYDAVTVAAGIDT